jgi:hypothetical protein
MPLKGLKFIPSNKLIMAIGGGGNYLLWGIPKLTSFLRM